MPLIVEDGTGVADADTWVSLADADAYFAERSITEWTSVTPAARREAALRLAADYLLFAYRWPGQASTIGQRLPWPRYGVRSGRGYFSSDDIPAQIIDAQILLAHEEIVNGPILRRVPVEKQLVEETKAAKGLSKTLKWATAPVDSVSGMRRFQTVDNILRGIAVGSVGGDMATVPLVRV